MFCHLNQVVATIDHLIWYAVVALIALREAHG